MKRYFVFVGEEFYPNLGMRDFIGDTDTIEEALDIIEKHYKTLTEKNNSSKEEIKYKHIEQIYDSFEKKIVHSFNEGIFEE